MWPRDRKKKIGEAQQALDEAKQHLREAKAREPAVQATVAHHKQVEERNHFAIHLTNVMGGMRLDP